MKTFNLDYLRKLDPCYNPAKYLPEDFNGTILDILNQTDCPFSDRLWVIMRTEFVSDKLMRLFAVWCARQVVDENTDPRSIEAINVADRFANGEATEEDLSAARSAASAAAWSAAWSAASAAAWSAAWSAVESAAYYAARSAARSAQESKLREMIVAGIKTGDVK